jgi:hypothetical protein
VGGTAAAVGALVAAGAWVGGGGAAQAERAKNAEPPPAIFKNCLRLSFFMFLFSLKDE